MQIKKFRTEFSGYYVTECGKVFREPSIKDKVKELIEVPQHMRGGDTGNRRCYPSINISIKDNGKTIKQIRYYVHRLIAETLLPNPNGYVEIDHIDRNKSNNCLSNLRWCDRIMNRSNR